jgi:hypothetical protein
MNVVHPLKRKSVKPSISTVRGMLPGKQFRALDAAMQSLRTAGLRLEWRWKDADFGWICAGMLDEKVVAELLPADEPLVGTVVLKPALVEQAKVSTSLPKKFRKILDFPVETKKTQVVYEFVLEDSKNRDFYSEFVEAIGAILQGEVAEGPDA